MNTESFVPGKNEKAPIFEKYMKENDLSFFRREDLGGPMDSVAFLTTLPAGENHRLVATVITDNSLYTLTRVHLGKAPTGEKRADFLHYLAHLNTQHSVFKYSVDEENHVFMDITVTSRPGAFDPDLIRTFLNLVSYFLQNEYEDIATHLALPGEKATDFTL